MKKSDRFNAVRMMREIREKLSEKYWNDPDLLRKEMKAIRRKYKIKPQALETA